MSQLAHLPNIAQQIILEYNAKLNAIDDVIKNYKTTIQQTNAAFRVMGEVTTSAMVRDDYINKEIAEHSLTSSAWQAVYKALGLDQVFSANDKKQFEQLLAKNPELTLENLKSVFGDYWDNPRYYLLKGLAEVFCSLDPFYRSHSNFGFGVKGLPKRAILRSFGGWSSWGYERLIDMCQAMKQVQPGLWLGEYVPTEGRTPWRDIIRGASKAWGKNDPFKLEQFGMDVRTFNNGNAHVHFNERALELINDCLHEFYGTVLPDSPEEKPDKKQTSTAVSKDLQFYRTPSDVVCRILDRVHLPGGVFLEPSCGDGAFLDELKKRGYQPYGVEIDYKRAQECLRKGHHVHIGNFLECHMPNNFDAVVMNPPFYGEHYLQHIDKAIECLKPGGTLVAVLPATAWHKHKKLPKGGIWQDLPVGSFRASGTNVNTGYWVYRKQCGSR